MTWYLALMIEVHLPHPLHHLKEPCSSTNTICFKRWRYSKANCFLSTTYISYDEVSSQRVKPSVHTFY